MDNLAKIKNNVKDPISGEVVVPNRDVGADEYERQIKAKLNEAKKNEALLKIIFHAGENKPLSPDQHDQQLENSPSAQNKEW